MRHFLIVLCLGAIVQQGPTALREDWQPLWHAPNAITIPIGETQSSQAIEIPKLSTEEGRLLCLRFQARMNSAGPAGWNDYLSLEWNGTRIAGKTAAQQGRVLNRRDIFRSKHPNYPLVPVASPRDGLPCFNVFFGPPNHEVEASVLTDRAEGYWYLLDIGDLPLAEPNRLVVTNTALKRYWNNAPPADCALVIEDLAVGTIPNEAVAELQAARRVQRDPLPDTSESGVGTLLFSRKGCGLQLTVDGEPYFVESAFSYPQDGGMGFNRLSCLPTIEGEPGWQPEMTSAGSELTIRAEGQYYRIERRVVTAKPRIEVTDAITNRTDKILGVAVRHHVITPQYPQHAFLAGLEVAVLGPGTSAENPTVFISQKATGLGVVAEDNALRLQMTRRIEDNTVQFGTERLGLAPGETYTMRWVLYPGSTDYFDFINQVRRDWNVNFTVDGPFDFFDTTRIATPEGRDQARAFLARRKLKLFGLTPWFEYYNGWSITRDEYKRRMQEAQAFVKSVVPDAKCLSCIETNLVPVDLSFFKDTVPKAGWPIGREVGGKYGQKATAEMTACVDASPWRDSCLRDADGSVLLDCWYVQYYKAPAALNLMVYPTLPSRFQVELGNEKGSHRHQHMLEQIAWLLDDVKLDGVYIDQFSLAWSDDTTRYSKEKWDGRTVRLDADGRIQSTITDLGLVSSTARRAWVESVLQRGKTVVCNTNPATAELQGLPAFRFMETQGYDPLSGDGPPSMPNMAKGQLGSPIGLGHSFSGTVGADFFMRTVIAHLRYGLLYYYYSTDFPSEDRDGRVGGEFGPVNHMFPFTPVELHEGWILGKERLITCVSREFNWPYDHEPHVLQFDSRGRERAPDAAITKSDNGYRVGIKLRDWWEIAVVE